MLSRCGTQGVLTGEHANHAASVVFVDIVEPDAVVAGDGGIHGVIGGGRHACGCRAGRHVVLASYRVGGRGRGGAAALLTGCMGSMGIFSVVCIVGGVIGGMCVRLESVSHSNDRHCDSPFAYEGRV
jgi:hypothetical protein